MRARVHVRMCGGNGGGGGVGVEWKACCGSYLEEDRKGQEEIHQGRVVVEGCCAVGLEKYGEGEGGEGQDGVEEALGDRYDDAGQALDEPLDLPLHDVLGARVHVPGLGGLAAEEPLCTRIKSHIITHGRGGRGGGGGGKDGGNGGVVVMVVVR